MEERILTASLIQAFCSYLYQEEKSKLTIEKYRRDVKRFADYLNRKEVEKEKLIAYKQDLVAEGYAFSSINSMLAALNSFFAYTGWDDLRMKAIKVQRQIFCEEEKELIKSEYLRLVDCALSRGKERLAMILRTIGTTGIRVSELKFITVEAVKQGKLQVCSKSKNRTVFLVKGLRKKLVTYVKKQRISSGSIFLTRSGRPVNRTNIWKEMKALCKAAGVSDKKVFPHNLRHLFARVFYQAEKDIAKLADILGHCSINTTRIYMVSSGREHLRCMEKMKMLM
ncbi:tyrosine-type recombinase/integrase [Emergencia sp. 1XD21-10]|uniref:tyrosine-type recombinase/integrase n=1 Tax=Emergencia sp. 1XD21-10 TaxID=2304569 RepID=UPI00137AB627|nr:tyrosine-type recombinase/integrase [Emergencia sp. 1XD21-10]NCE97594.1 integrase [Emergencia sp. 1XD21-10]